MSSDRNRTPYATPSCPSGKRAWPSKADARRALRQTQSRPGVAVCRAYRCPDCGAWHHTSLRRWVERPDGSRGSEV